jgi:hypothetical protein
VRVSRERVTPVISPQENLRLNSFGIVSEQNTQNRLRQSPLERNRAVSDPGAREP